MWGRGRCVVCTIARERLKHKEGRKEEETPIMRAFPVFGFLSFFCPPLPLWHTHIHTHASLQKTKPVPPLHTPSKAPLS